MLPRHTDTCRRGPERQIDKHPESPQRYDINSIGDSGRGVLGGEFADESQEIGRQQVGGLQGGEVATALVLGPVRDRVRALGEAADRQLGQVRS